MENQGFPGLERSYKRHGNSCQYYLSVVARLSFAVSNQPLICNAHFYLFKMKFHPTCYLVEYPFLLAICQIAGLNWLHILEYFELEVAISAKLLFFI